MRYPAKIRIRCFLMAIIMLLLAIPCFAFADDAGEKPQKENSLQPGSWALQFQLEQEFSLEPFDDLILAIKRHSSRHSAFRFGFDLDLEFSDNDDQRDSFYPDSLWFAQNDVRDQNFQQIALDFMYLNYPNPDAPVHFFWGAGPLVILSRSESNSERFYDSSTGNGERRVMETWTRSWSVGGRGLVAAEWFVTQAISLHTEYRVSIRYSSSRYKNNSIRERPDDSKWIDTNDRTEDKWDLDAERVILGLNLYF